MTTIKHGPPSVPPADAVPWTVTLRRTRKAIGTVHAQTWFAARRRAMEQFQLAASEIYVTLEDTDTDPAA